MTEHFANTQSPEKSSEGLISLAQRLHDEHVANGKAEAERIVADAEERSAKLLAEAERIHTEKTEEAQLYADQLVEDSKQQLEEQTERILVLQEFEGNYRQELQHLVDRAQSVLNPVSEDVENTTPELDSILDEDEAPHEEDVETNGEADVEENVEESHDQDGVYTQEHDTKLPESEEDGTNNNV